MANDSFLLYNGFWAPIQHFSDEMLGRLFRAIYRYQTEGIVPADLDPTTALAFGFFHNQFKLDEEKYARVCRARQEAGSRGGRQKAANVANATNCQQLLPNDSKSTLNDTDNEPYTETDTQNVCVFKGDSTHTQYLEILFFRNIKNAMSETRRFISFYESTNWTLTGGDRLDGDQRIAKAKLWTPQDKTPRFTKAVLNAWGKLYQSLPAELRTDALTDPTRADGPTENGVLTIYCAPSIYRWMFIDKLGYETGASIFKSLSSKYKLTLKPYVTE